MSSGGLVVQYISPEGISFWYSPQEGEVKNPLEDLPPREPLKLDWPSVVNPLEGRITLQTGQQPSRKSKFRLEGDIFVWRIFGGSEMATCEDTGVVTR